MAFRIHKGLWQFQNSSGTYETKYKINTSGQIVETDAEGNETAPLSSGGGGDATSVGGYSASSLLKLAEWNGNLYAHTDGRIYATIFYDSNDSGWYVDPRSTSRMNTIYCGDVYNDQGGWFRNYGTTGIYNQSYGTHFYSNGGANWVITGSGGNIELQFRSNHQSTLRGWVYATTSNEIGFLSEDGNWVLRTWNRGVHAYGSMRSPIYYDSDDTDYYLDLNSTSNSAMRIRGGTLHGPNPSWGKYLYVGSDGRVGANASVAVTNGNLHIDCEDGYGLYLNWYSQNNIYTRGNLGVGSDSASYRLHVHGTGYATDDFRAPIFYDSNDTTYYLDPNSISVLAGFNLNSAGTAKFRYLAPGEGTVNIGAPFAHNPATGAINIAMTDNDTGGVVIDNEGVTVYGAGDTGTVFRVIDEDVWQSNGNNVDAATTFRVYQGADAGTYTRGPINTSGSITTEGYLYSNNSIRVGEIWGHAGIYRSSGHMMFGTEGGHWYFQSSNNTRAYISQSDGNIWMQWAGDWLSNLLGDKQAASTAINTGNIGSQSVNYASYSGAVYGNQGGSFGLNDTKLYLRTNGDNNHYLWNADDDWEELNAYEGTGFRITSNGGGTGILYVYGASNGGYTYSPYSFRAPIFYDSEDTGYYLDPNSTSNVRNMTAYAFTGNGNVGGTGSASWHPNGIYSAGYNWIYGGINGGGASATNFGDVRANIFYDAQDTGYYLDPNDTSNLWRFTEGTLNRHSLNSRQTNSPWSTRASQGTLYQTGAMGWGQVDLNVIASNWGSGFFDTWSSPGNGPGASSHYVGVQAFHYNNSDSSKFHGWQMACAQEANNRWFWRSSWDTPRAWVEMIHSGNIGSQSVSYASSAGNADTVDGWHRDDIRNAANLTNQSGMWTSDARPGAYRLYRNDDNSAYNVQTTWSADVSGYWSLRGYYNDDYHAACYVARSGYADSAGSAGSVAWDNVSGKPSVATHRGEGSNYIDYSRYVYNNGAYSGSGWIEPSDLGVRYAYYGRLVYNNGAYSGSGWVEPSDLGVRYASSTGKLDTGYVVTSSNNIYLYANADGNESYRIHHNGGGGVFDVASQFAIRPASTDFPEIRYILNDWVGYFWYNVDPWGDNWGIGANPYSWAFVNRGNMLTFGFEDWSDRRHKSAIVEIDNAVDKVKAISGYTYWKRGSEVREGGVIAQDVLEVFPEAVGGNEEGYSIKPSALIGLLSKAVKEQQEMIDALTARIEALENK